MPAETSPEVGDAACEIAARLSVALRSLGHEVTPLCNCPPGRAEVHLLVDPRPIDDESPVRCDFLGSKVALRAVVDPLALRVVAEADSSGRLARLLVSYEARSGTRARWGGADTVGTFADLGELAKQISEEVRSHGR